VGVETSNLFINACCVIETSLDPGELLGICKELEWRAGRVAGDADRPLDIDIIIFGEREIDESDLVVPHPRLRDRRFVIEPLAEIIPDLELPPDGRRPGELCSDAGCLGLVRKISSRSFARGV
jgi:2-amino-4-hydroxy-6-hydroxymethyldihydropteridine diphosphokinase